MERLREIHDRTLLPHDPPNPYYGDVLPTLCALHESNRIRETLRASEIVRPVFPSKEENMRFIAGLWEIVRISGSTLEIGGRGLRKMVGCKTYDIAPYIASYTRWHLSDHDGLRLGEHVVAQLLEYAKRFSEPDSDFFFWETKPSTIKSILSSHKFKPKLHHATGNVPVIEVKSNKGSATFVDGDESWQTQEPWPPYGFRAPLEIEESGHLVARVNISAARIYNYPLELPGISQYEPDEPRRVAAVGRSLVWECLSRDPQGNFLKVPGFSTQHGILKTVEVLPKIYENVERNPAQLALYRGGLRDAALALLVINANRDNLDRIDPFFGQVLATFQMAKIDLYRA